MRSQYAYKREIFKFTVQSFEQLGHSAAMNRLQAMEVFVCVVDTGSFTRTATQLGLPKATVSTLVRQLEARLGVRLLNRTTRRVSVTVDGTAYYERCVRILAEIEDSEHAIAGTGAGLHGRLRVDVGATFGRRFLVPSLPEFFARYPDIRLELGCGDRPVDIVEEGVDCVVRGGSPLDSSLIAQPVGAVELLYCASPRYLAARGAPRHPRDLIEHDVVRYFSTRFGATDTWNFNRGGERLELKLDGRFAVNDSEAYLEAGLAGLGVIEMTTFMAGAPLSEGRLVRILPDWHPDPVPIHVMYPPSRRLSAKVKVFVAWVASLIDREVGSRESGGAHPVAGVHAA